MSLSVSATSSSSSSQEPGRTARQHWELLAKRVKEMQHFKDGGCIFDCTSQKGVSRCDLTSGETLQWKGRPIYFYVNSEGPMIFGRACHTSYVTIVNGNDTQVIVTEQENMREADKPAELNQWAFDSTLVKVANVRITCSCPGCNYCRFWEKHQIHHRAENI